PAEAALEDESEDSVAVSGRFTVGRHLPDEVPSALDDRSVGAEETHPRLIHRDARAREDAGEPEGVSSADVRPIVPPESDDVDELGILGEQLGQGVDIRPVPGVLAAVDDRLVCLQHVPCSFGAGSSCEIRASSACLSYALFRGQSELLCWPCEEDATRHTA